MPCKPGHKSTSRKKQPMHSQAQWKKLFAMVGRGEITLAQAKAHARRTKRPFAALPKIKGKPTSRDRIAAMAQARRRG